MAPPDLHRSGWYPPGEGRVAKKVHRYVQKGSYVSPYVAMHHMLTVYTDVPYLHAPTKKKDKERQFANFVDILKRLQINILFAKALEHMPTYTKFMKELMTKKRKFNDQEIVDIFSNIFFIYLQ